MTTFLLPPLPGDVHWNSLPIFWKVGTDNSLTIAAGAATDLFIDPGGHPPKDNAPCALFTPPDANFLLSAKVKVDFASTFDAGVLQLQENADHWAKLCFEYSPQGQPTIVSVVTRGRSDDCNSTAIDGEEVYLRMAVTPQTVAFHYSCDGASWRLVRYFTLGALASPTAGLSAQSPTGRQCTAMFSEITYRPGVLADIRNGE